MNIESKNKMPNSINTVTDVVQLCKFAKDATNSNDEFCKGMCEAFDYVIKCCSEPLSKTKYCLDDVVSEPMVRLAKEYLSKVNYCDECFCETWCIINGTKASRVPYKGCECNVINNLFEIFRDEKSHL